VLLLPPVVLAAADQLLRRKHRVCLSASNKETRNDTRQFDKQ
jgi:hypothetical protein